MFFGNCVSMSLKCVFLLVLSAWAMDKLKWDQGICNCPAFFKNFMCKHIVGVAIRLNLDKPPPAGKDVQIGEKRRRGRSSKAKKALLVQ